MRGGWGEGCLYILFKYLRSLREAPSPGLLLQGPNLWCRAGGAAVGARARRSASGFRGKRRALRRVFPEVHLAPTEGAPPKFAPGIRAPWQLDKKYVYACLFALYFSPQKNEPSFSVLILAIRFIRLKMHLPGIGVMTDCVLFCHDEKEGGPQRGVF